MTGRAGRRGKDRVGFIIAAPGPHQNPRKIAELLSAPPDDLDSQFRATYTSLLNLLDAFGSFAQVTGDRGTKLCLSQSSASNSSTGKDTRGKRQSVFSERIADLSQAECFTPCSDSSASPARRSRLIEGAPHTRREMRQRWLNKMVAAWPRSRCGPQWPAPGIDHRARTGRRNRHPRRRPPSLRFLYSALAACSPRPSQPGRRESTRPSTKFTIGADELASG